MNLPISSQSETHPSEEAITSKDALAKKLLLSTYYYMSETDTIASDWKYIDQVFGSVIEMYQEKTEKINTFLQ